MKLALARILLVPLPSCRLVVSGFVQHVPSSVAGSLTRFAAQSPPLRLWPNEQEQQNETSSGSGPAAIESCGWRFQVPEWKPGQKGCFLTVLPQNILVQSQQSLAFFLPFAQRET